MAFVQLQPSMLKALKPFNILLQPAYAARRSHHSDGYCSSSLGLLSMGMRVFSKALCGHWIARFHAVARSQPEICSFNFVVSYQNRPGEVA